MNDDERFLKQVEGIKVQIVNDYRAPHKPLLLLRRLRCAVFCRLPSARSPANRFGRPSADPQGSRRRAYAEQKWNLFQRRAANSRRAGPWRRHSWSGLGWNLRKRRSRRGGFAVFRARIGVKEIPRP